MKIKGYTPVGVALTRDEHGIPHIQADDLAGAYWGGGVCPCTGSGDADGFDAAPRTGSGRRVP